MKKNTRKNGIVKTALNASFLLVTLLLMAAPVLADHYPDQRDMYRIEELADDLKRSTRNLYKDARHYADEHSYHEAHALRQLNRFKKAADEFECAVQEYYGDPYATEKYFEDLYYSAKLVDDTFRDLHHHDHLYKDYHYTKSLVRKLGHYYGYSSKAYEKGRYGKRSPKPRVSVRINWPF